MYDLIIVGKYSFENDYRLLILQAGVFLNKVEFRADNSISGSFWELGQTINHSFKFQPTYATIVRPHRFLLLLNIQTGPNN